MEIELQVKIIKILNLNKNSKSVETVLELVPATDATLSMSSSIISRSASLPVGSFTTSKMEWTDRRWLSMEVVVFDLDLLM